MLRLGLMPSKQEMVFIAGVRYPSIKHFRAK